MRGGCGWSTPLNGYRTWNPTRIDCQKVVQTHFVFASCDVLEGRRVVGRGGGLRGGWVGCRERVVEREGGD